MLTFKWICWHNVKVKGLSQTDRQGHEIRKRRKKAKEDKKNKQKPFCVVVGNQTHDPELIRTSLSLFSLTACPSELSVLLYDSFSLSLFHSILLSFLFLLKSFSSHVFVSWVPFSFSVACGGLPRKQSPLFFFFFFTLMTYTSFNLNMY